MDCFPFGFAVRRAALSITPGSLDQNSTNSPRREKSRAGAFASLVKSKAHGCSIYRAYWLSLRTAEMKTRKHPLTEASRRVADADSSAKNGMRTSPPLGNSRIGPENVPYS